MAMIRSSMGKVIRRALSVRNPQPLRRCKHDGPAADSTSAAREVDTFIETLEDRGVCSVNKELVHQIPCSIDQARKKKVQSNLTQAALMGALIVGGFTIGSSLVSQDE